MVTITFGGDNCVYIIFDGCPDSLSTIGSHVFEILMSSSMVCDLLEENLVKRSVGQRTKMIGETLFTGLL
jgi:hypothetical protein